MPWLEKTLYIVLIYLVVINVVTFFIYGIDKWKAKRSKWRIAFYRNLLVNIAYVGQDACWA